MTVFDGKFASVLSEMETAIEEIDIMPEWREFSNEEIDVLESVRHAALRLAARAEAIIEDAGGDS